MLHENHLENEIESAEQSATRKKWSMILLAIFSSIYAGFICLCAFSYQWFSNLALMGVPAPVWYGLALILLALGIAGVYGTLTRSKSN